MGPQNVIMGDQNFGTDLPKTEGTDDDALEESVQRAATFAKGSEYNRLKAIMQSRIDAWKMYAPGADNPVMYRDLNNDERGWRSLVADVLISEFTSVFTAYEQAIEETKAKNKK
jgi:hypothetical protein